MDLDYKKFCEQAKIHGLETPSLKDYIQNRKFTVITALNRLMNKQKGTRKKIKKERIQKETEVSKIKHLTIKKIEDNHCPLPEEHKDICDWECTRCWASKNNNVFCSKKICIRVEE